MLKASGLEHAEPFMELNMELFHRNDHTFSTHFNHLLSEQRRRCVAYMSFPPPPTHTHSLVSLFLTRDILSCRRRCGLHAS